MTSFTELGISTATRSTVFLHPGTDLARVRRALALVDAERAALGLDTLAGVRRKAFASGVRSKLTQYRELGVIR